MALDPRPEQCILGLGLKAQGHIDRCRDENMAESRGQAWGGGFKDGWCARGGNFKEHYLTDCHSL